MKLGGDQTTLDRARILRGAATLPERLLWAALRQKQHGLRFRRQHPAGSYILDFYCPSARLCVEIDGAQHNQTTASDARRDKWLANQGIHVIRVPATEVLRDPDAVAQWIASQAPLRRSAPPPPEEGEER